MKHFIMLLMLVMIGCGMAQTIQEVSLVTPQVRQFELTFNVTPSHSPMDGLYALSGVSAVSWGDLSIIVRCNQDGQFDARNGGEYTSDAVLPYEAGQAYSVRITADVFTQTYSVFITPEGGEETTIATDYAFRAAADILRYQCIFLMDDPENGGVAGSSLTVKDVTFSEPADRLPCPLGTEEVRYDAQCDTAIAWDDLGLFDSCPVLHEYTAYQGTIMVDGDPSDADWAKIPWTAMDVYENLKDGLDRSFMAWQLWDDFWASWNDYSGFFKILWNPDQGVIYYLFKEYDDMIVWPGDAYTDAFAEDVSTVNQWQGDTYEIEMFPMDKDLPETSLETIGNIFVVDGEVRFKPLTIANPPAALELADGDGATSFPDTDGKAIFYTRNEETGENIFELAIQLHDNMTAESAWYFGIAKTEGDDEYDDGKNREMNFYWGAGKRKVSQWASLLFSVETVPQTAVADRTTPVQPASFQLGANYPNPFNPSTTIPFTLNKTEHVTISIFNGLGQKIKTLVQDTRSAGEYSVSWDGTDSMGNQVVSGIYLIQMTTGQETFTQKALFVQ